MLTALLDHLWQSTLFALVVAMLVLAFRRAPAAVRHGLWCAASLKFLIPFAALAAAGVWLAPDVRLPAPVAQTVMLKTAAAPFSQAFGQVAAEPPIAVAAPAPVTQAQPAPVSPAPAILSSIGQAPAAPSVRIDPVAILLGIWAAGSLLILARWTVRWTRLRRAIASAKPVAWPAPMPVKASSWLIEPGLAGLLKPVLIVPETLPGRLSRSEIDAIVAHEASHLRRKDNLTAALHMLVEALFWFHPLVWWIGGRLIAEREIACDEAVVRAGHHRAAYARALMESCRDYLQSPLDCMAGASGPDLKTRIEQIMTAPPASPLSRSKKALLMAAGACAVATPVMAGLVSPEVRQAAAPLVKAVSAMAAPARSLAAQSDGLADASAQQQPVVLARESRVLASAPSVAPISAPPQALSRDIAAPGVIAVAQAETAAAPAPAPAQTADPRAEAAAFVQTYAAVTAKRAIARWAQPICVNVVDLANRAETPQEIAARHRIEEVAKDVGLEVRSGQRIVAVAKGAGVELRSSDQCGGADIEIAFTSDPQAMLNATIKTSSRRLGDASSGTRSATTVTLPIQAWYETNGKDVAANDTGDLKALSDFRPDYRPDARSGLKVPVLYQQWAPGPGQPTISSNSIYGGNANGAALAREPYPYSAPDSATGGSIWSDGPRSRPMALWAKRQFVNAMVIVDLKRTNGATPRAIADYVTMLALSQPKSLGSCQALPSIVDLYASCPGRAAPTGLTSADMAYLHALYAGDEKSRIDHPAEVAGVAEGMAARLADAGAVGSTAQAAPAAPDKLVHPAAFREAAPEQSPLLQLASYRSEDASAHASDFVRANARTSQFGYTVRWEERLCLQVEGLTPEQNAAVMSRIDAVAQTLSGDVYASRQSCPQKNAWILFTPEPQRLLDSIVARDPRFLGDAHSDTKGIKTVSQPIQAWRQTLCIWSSCAPEPYPERPIETTVMVDSRRVDGAKLGAITDYVAMLILADPRTTDRCQVLPSVLDLFSNCPGRPAPTGLTVSDLSYLKALYTAGIPITMHVWNRGEHGGTLDQVAGRMATLLDGHGTLLKPGAVPERR